MIFATRAKPMFSSCSPMAALVAGVKIVCGQLRRLPAAPGGSVMPQIAPVS